MKGQKETLVGFVGALLLASTVTAAQSPAVTKFVTPIKGQAQIEYMAPQSRVEGNTVVTRIKVKNVSKGPIALLQVDEYWYNAKGDQVSGSPAFRWLKPMMPGEIVEVVLKSPKTSDMSRSQRVFKHANGSVKPTLVPAFKKDS